MRLTKYNGKMRKLERLCSANRDLESDVVDDVSKLSGSSKLGQSYLQNSVYGLLFQEGLRGAEIAFINLYY